MTLRQSINQIRKKFHDKVTEFKFVELCTISLLLTYLPLVLIGVIIAYLFGGTRIGPGEYYIWTNWISDLGGSPFTPAPYLYDIACIVAGILTIPFTFYMEKLLVPMPKKPEDYNKTSRLRYRIGSWAFLFSIIGNVGYIGVGIFSEDRNYYGMHGITSALAFGGFTLGAFFLGWLIVLYEPRIVGKLCDSV